MPEALLLVEMGRHRLGWDAGADGGAWGCSAVATGATRMPTAAAPPATPAATMTAPPPPHRVRRVESGDGTDSTGAEPPLYDVGTIPDAPGYACDGAGGPGGSQVEFSYIWIANSSQNTISKINTVSMEEEGRYQAKPSGGDPSRTSVSLSGNVAVANRNGGVAKFYANAADCVDSNGTPGIQTSSGGNDVLAWDEEECRAWYTDFTCQSNRPVAWTRGDWNESECAFENEKLWTACDDLAIQIDGDTGEVEHAIKLDPAGTSSWHFVYGGAADADGNFWALDTGFGQLYRVDGEDYTVTEYPLPSGGGYGITVDGVGRPWVCGGGSASRFQPRRLDVDQQRRGLRWHRRLHDRRRGPHLAHQLVTERRGRVRYRDPRDRRRDSVARVRPRDQHRLPGQRLGSQLPPAPTPTGRIP